jgi:predicted ribosome quality control (RQC) complex YloA/Tae2 family protein
VELMSFDQTRMITIKLKKGLSPQENAAKFYQKSKNERKQLQYLKTTLEELETKREEITQKILQTQKTDHLKEFKTSTKNLETKQPPPLPYKTIFVDGYEARIGKGAHQNDELLRNHAGKDDLWFHIKNFAGSHVILRNPSKKVVPINVIERTAEIAAFHSKGKNETLAAVIYTPRKFVRKVKNGNPGQVIVTKEEVILVEPKN